MGSAALRTLNGAALRYKHTAALRSALEKKYAPASVNQMLCALRRVLKEALRLDLIDPLDYSKAVDVRSVKQSGKPRGRALSPDEIAALVQSCSGESTLDVRDAALIAILRGGGITALLHPSGGFLNVAGERGQGFGSGDRSGGLICLVNDTSAEIEVK
jgi:site-specific recombinase XerD